MSPSYTDKREYRKNKELPKDLYFTFFNPDVEGFYVEVENPESVTEVIEKLL